MSGEAVEITTGRERRRRWSVSEKPRIVAESEARGVRVADVAARHGGSASGRDLRFDAEPP